MGYTNKVISLNSTELQFIKTFALELTAADSRIVCETDIDEQFADTANKPTIIFNINNCYKIKLVRKNALSDVSNPTDYYIYSIYNDIENTNAGAFSFTKYNYAADSINTRSCKIQVISGENTIAIMIGNYNQTLPTDHTFNTVSMHSSDFNAVVLFGSGNINFSTGTSIRTDNGHQNETYTSPIRLNYQRENNNIEIIKNKAFLNSGMAIKNFEGLFDCSKVTANSIITIDNENYYSLDEHTLAAI